VRRTLPPLVPSALRATVLDLARTPWGRAGVAALAVLAVATLTLGLAGGLRPVQVAEARFDAGEVVDVGPVRVTVLDHVVTDEILVEDLAEEGAGAWLGVRVEVAAAEARTVRSLPDLLEPPEDVLLDLSEDDAYGYPREVLVSDGSELPRIQPGLPEQVLLLWPVADARDVPEDLDVTLFAAEQYYSVRYQSVEWATEEPRALVAVPRTTRVPPAVLDRLGEEGP
jgi:hypothetical protein